MFDDQTTNPAGSPPQNLPMEPDDIFAGVDLPAHGTTTNSVGAPSIPNALDAGILKKKEAPTSTPAPVSRPEPRPIASGLAPAPASAPVSYIPQPVAPNQPVPNVTLPTVPAVYSMKEPILGKIILVIVLGVVLGGLGFGGWWVYNYMQSGGRIKDLTTKSAPDVIKGPGEEETAIPARTTADNVEAIPDVVPNTTTPAPTNNNVDVPAAMNNDKILFGEPVDSDKDGLDDVREQELGVDPNKADTDNDGLTDGDEVLIWKTNPLKADTDGDTYLDGDEVRHGYNPLGLGKLFNAVATSTKK